MAFAVRRFWMFLQWLYFQYTIHLGVSTFEPWEVRIFNSLVVLMLMLSIYTTYLFMPGHIRMWIGVFRWLAASGVELLSGSVGSSATD